MKKILILLIICLARPVQAINFEQVKTAMRSYARYLPLVSFGVCSVHNHIALYNERSDLNNAYNGLVKWQDNNLFKETEDNKQERTVFFNSLPCKALTKFMNKNYSDTQNETFKTSDDVHESKDMIAKIKWDVKKNLQITDAQYFYTLSEALNLILLGYIIHQKSIFFSKLSGIALSAFGCYGFINNPCGHIACTLYGGTNVVFGALAAYYG